MGGWSIEYFIEDQALPTPLYPPLPTASCLSFSVFLCVAGQAYWRGGEGFGGTKSYDGEKSWSSINHSVLSEGGDESKAQL